jgi:beta-barrel assembly-enhancing protease
MSQKFSADYFDGRTARKQNVSVSVSREGLHFALESKGDVLWDFEKVCLQKIGNNLQNLRFEYEIETEEGRFVESLIVADLKFLEQIIALAPPGFSTPLRPPDLKRKIGFALGVLLIPFVLYGLWVSIIPSVARSLTLKVPVAWEEKLGDTILSSISPAETRKNAPQTQEALEAIVARLLATDPEQPYKIKIHLQSDSLVNAFALPGGHIIVFQGLLDETDSAEEMAGILAHELQHVLRRHTTQAIIRSASIYLVFSTLTGDVTGAMQTVLDTASNLGHLSMNRSMETEADQDGMLMILKAGINPAGMIRAFQKLDENMKGENNQSSSEDLNAESSSNILKYISTHPLGAERVKNLQDIARNSTEKNYSPILPDLDWRKMIQREFPKLKNRKETL